MKYRGQKKWEIIPRQFDDPIDQILFNRKIELSQKDNFLKPDFEHDLADPFLLTNIDQSINRLIQAIEKKEKVGIFADYDADGVTSAVLLSEYLKSLGLVFDIYIPSRDQG